MMRDVLVMGIGLHPFGRFPEKTFEEISYPAIKEALDDSNIPFKDIEVAFCGVVNSALYDSRNVIQQFGWSGIMIHSLAQASGSSAAAFRLAYWAIATGLYDTALVAGYEKIHGLMTGTIDLVFVHDARVYVLDYKSNTLGKAPRFYDQIRCPSTK